MFIFLIMLFAFIFVNWCATGFPYQMMLVSFTNNPTGATSSAETVYLSGASEFNPGFSGVRVSQSFVSG